MAVSLLYALVPKGAILTAAKCTGSLILVLVMLRPLVTLQIADAAPSLEDWEAAIEEQSEQMTQENAQQMEELIETECSAYISEKAAQLGLSVSAEVYCVLREGVPFPSAVTLDIPYNAALSQRIAEDLDIDPSHQYWQGSGGAT